MGIIERRGDEYNLTSDGREFVADAVTSWADPETPLTTIDDDPTAGTYETTIHARAVDPESRATVLSRHGKTCSVFEIDHSGLLDVAHVLPWSEYPDLRADLSDIIPLSKTHHTAFDKGLFTIDQDYRLRVNPVFETQSKVLQRTIIDQAGTSL